MILAATLDRILRHPETLAHEANKLDRRYGRTLAVLVVDMVGFSRLTAAEGPVGGLLGVRRMFNRAKQPVWEAAGVILKVDADNLFCVFPTVKGADEVARFLTADGSCSAGIGFGRMLVFKADLYGDEVNKASKLGEDIAGPGEVLLTEAAQRILYRVEGAQ